VSRTSARSIGFLLALCSFAPGVAAALDPYTETLRNTRQAPWLQSTRALFDTGLAYATANEFPLTRQLEAIAAEIEAQERELAGTPVEFEVLDAHLLEVVERLPVTIEPGNACPPLPQSQPAGCTKNEVIAWRAIFLAAYVLAKYEQLGSETWSQATRDAALALFRDPNLDYKGLIGLGNTAIPVIGTRLLGGLALDDVELRKRGITEFTYAFDEDVRRGIPEPLSPHYAGPTLAELALLIEGLGDSCSLPCAGGDLNGVRQKARDFMSFFLLVVGHHYLPGGGVGTPQERKGGGALTDPDPTDSDHLIQTVHTLAYDPNLENTEVTFVWRLAGVAYTPEEIVRSILFDKGNGYTFWRRDRVANQATNGGTFPGLRSYPLGIHGSYWNYLTGNFVDGGLPVSPVQVVMLPGGQAATGIGYGAGGTNQISSGTYLRDPDGSIQASDADLGFAILHHRQPKNGPPGGSDFTKPLEDDLLWTHEQRTPHRRMMLGGTTLTLFDTSEVPAGGPAPIWDFSQVHLPDFSGESANDAIQDTCNGWRVIGVKDKWWLGFRPLADSVSEDAMDGPHDPNSNKSGDEQGGDWIYLELSSSSSITGDVSVLEPGSAYDVPGSYATLELAKAAFCNDLDARTVVFSASAGSVSVNAIEPGTGRPVRMELTHASDLRTLQYLDEDPLQDPVPQADADFLDHGLVRSVWVGDPSSSVAFDDETFELTVKRGGYNDLALYLGPDGGVETEIPPTAPGIMEVRWQQTNWTQTRFQWNGMPWDDGSVAGYEVWRGEPDTGTLLDDDVPGSQNWFIDAHGDPELTRCALQIQQNPTEQVLYTVRARDDDDNLSPNHARLLVPEDAKPPSAVGNLAGQAAGPAKIGLSWSAATDECNVYAYHILRDDGAGGPLAPVTTVLGAATTSWTDTCRDPSRTYTYEVQAVDTAPNWGPGVQTSASAGSITLPAPGGLGAYHPGGSTVTLYWLGGSPCVQGYELERTRTDVNPTQTTTLSTGYIWYQDAPGPGTYTYRVRMVSKWGEEGPLSGATNPIQIQ
jgi:hypothetical protein